MGSDAELDSFGRMQAGLEQLQFTINAMPPDKNGQLLATDYLTGLRTHIDATLKNKFPESFLKANPVTYYLTVPAVRHIDKLTLSERSNANMYKTSRYGRIQPKRVLSWPPKQLVWGGGRKYSSCRSPRQRQPMSSRLLRRQRTV